MEDEEGAFEGLDGVCGCFFIGEEETRDGKESEGGEAATAAVEKVEDDKEVPVQATGVAEQ